jgi:hypothetical protein
MASGARLSRPGVDDERHLAPRVLSVHRGKRPKEADVKLINTDGLALIGPGSEWFWTAISGIVLAVTFLAIYRQLRLQRSQGAIEQIAAFTREWNSERMLVHRRNVLIALRDGTDRKVLPEGAVSMVGN